MEQKLLKLYKKVVEENIDLFAVHMNNVKARITYDEDFTIFMDYSKISSEREEKEILSEELGHYYYNALYTLLDTPTTVSQQEYRAKKYQATQLCPIQDIERCVKKGMQYSYEIAEELDVSQDIVEFAIEYYKNNNMINLC